MSQPARRLSILLLLVGGLLLVGCERLPAPEQSGELVIGIHEAPGFYQPEDGKPAGYEYDLVVAFAEKLKLRPTLITVAGPAELIALARQQRVHVAVGLPIGLGELRYTDPIRKIGQVVVGQADGLGPDEIDELGEYSVKTVAGSAINTVLRELSTPPAIAETPNVNAMELLAEVAQQRNALAAVHDIDFDLAQNFYPELRARVKLPGAVGFGWALAGPTAGSLKAKADSFLAEAAASGLLTRAHDRYFGHIKRITPQGVSQFINDIHRRLPPFKKAFQRAQELTGIDWRLLAALAYQESKWDPLATSFTNVRGIMMLTEETADRLHVGNRLDPNECIRGGSRYLLDLVEQVPADTPYPDRLWLGLAAYNLGMGHLRGGLAIAKGMKRDTRRWYEMKKVLPMLSRPEIYARLKSGLARGGEAVMMVENVRTYFDILARFEPPYRMPFPRPLLRPTQAASMTSPLR